MARSQRGEAQPGGAQLGLCRRGVARSKRGNAKPKPATGFDPESGSTSTYRLSLGDQLTNEPLKLVLTDEFSDDMPDDQMWRPLGECAEIVGLFADIPGPFLGTLHRRGL